jgi:hypothetical protein
MSEENQNQNTGPGTGNEPVQQEQKPHPLSDANKKQVATAVQDGTAVTEETRKQILEEQAAAMHDPQPEPEPEIEPAGEVSVEDGEEIETDDVTVEAPFEATPHALLSDAFDLVQPRLRLNVIIPLVGGLAEDKEDYYVDLESGERVNLYNTLAAPKPGKAVGVAYDALASVLESLTQFNSHEFFIVADDLHKESALNLISTSLPDQMNLDLPIDMEEIVNITGVSPILTGSPTVDGEDVVFNLVIPFPLLVDRNADEGLRKVIGLIDKIVNRKANDEAVYDVDADLMFVVNPADFAYQTNLAGLVTALVEDGFVQTNFSELHGELEAVHAQGALEEFLDEHLDEEDLDDLDDEDYDEDSDDLDDSDDEDEDEDGDDEDMADEDDMEEGEEDEGEELALIDSFAAPVDLEALIEALEGCGLDQPTTLIYVRPL